jgi:hypothetical protein
MFRSALPTDELTRALYLLPAPSTQRIILISNHPRLIARHALTNWAATPSQKNLGHQAVIIWALGLIEQLHSNGRLQ